MTLNYPHESLVVHKANAVVGGSKPVSEIPTRPNGELCHGGKIPHVCQKRKKRKKVRVSSMIFVQHAEEIMDFFRFLLCNEIMRYI